MGFATGTAFLTVLAGVSTVLVGLWILIQHRNGLDVPSESPVVTQLVLNYLPILFATLLEPFRILLNKKLCLFKPFETLLGGEAKAAQAVDFKYTSLPQIDHMASSESPSRDSGRCLCHGTVNKFLAVVSNALLQPWLTLISSSSAFLTTSLPTVNQIPSELTSSDHLYIAATNFSHAPPLSAWVTRDPYLLPFQTNTTPPLDTVQTYKVITAGFGPNIVCINQTWHEPAYIPEGGYPKIFFNQTNVY